MAHIANLPLIPIMHASPNNANEIAFKTIPCATKLEIKQLLQSFYGLEVQKVRTLNMKGKKKRIGGCSVASKPDYKKAYVTLKNPLPNSPVLYPSLSSAVDEDNKKKNQKMMMAMQY